MTSSKSVVFYDIASGPPQTCYAPNPWKTRYALNLKKINYETSWVEFLAVKATRLRLGPAPNRTLPDGSDFYTLPIIQDHAHDDIVIGDSFDIAVYLDDVYRGQGTTLFPNTVNVGLYRAFNAQVDAIFTNCVPLCMHGMPFDPATRDADIKQFEDRAGGMKWEDMCVKGDARTAMFEKLKGGLADGLGKAYRQVDGPFLDGATPTYADVIVGAWLRFYQATLAMAEWEDICAWHDGVWGRLHRALEPYAEVK